MIVSSPEAIESDVFLQLIKQDPAGPVTKAVRALGQLHQKRMRVSQGMEADTKPEHSPAVYFRNEALMQLKGNKDLQRRLTEADAIAAFYLVLFSQLAGCIADWDEPFAILSEWLVQTGLPVTEEPWLFFQGMTAAGRLAVKGALVSESSLEKMLQRFSDSISSGSIFSLASPQGEVQNSSRFGDVYSGNEGRIGTRTICHSSEVFGWTP